MSMQPTRRRFLTALSLAGAAAILPCRRSLAAEEPPEVTYVRINKSPSICVTPQHITRELLHAEGFHRRPIRTKPAQWLSNAACPCQRSIRFRPGLRAKECGGDRPRRSHHILAGVHVGCFELFAADGIRGVADLRGKSVGVAALGSPQHMFLAPIAAHVGIDPSKDIDWVVNPSVKPMQLFIDGKIDAFLGLPPEPQELRARKIGHVIVNSAVDRPWSQYFCCMLTATASSSAGIRSRPSACYAPSSRPPICAPLSRRARRSDWSTAASPSATTMRCRRSSELPYDKWREYDPEDTVRFYALRLRETGIIKSSPQKIIADGTDWRFLNELKRELKT